jgi:hypothetical protein
MSVKSAKRLGLILNEKQDFFGQNNVYVRPPSNFIQPGIISGTYGNDQTLQNYNFDIGTEDAIIRLYVPEKRIYEKNRSRILIADFTNIEIKNGTNIRNIKWEKRTNNDENWTTIESETERTYTLTYSDTSTQFRVSCSYNNEKIATSNPTFPLSAKEQDTIEENAQLRMIDFAFSGNLNNLPEIFTNTEFRKTLTNVYFSDELITTNELITTISNSGFLDENGSFLYENIQEVEVPNTVTSITGTPFPPQTRYYIRSINKYTNPTDYPWVNDTTNPKQLYFYLNKNGNQLAKTRDDDGVEPVLIQSEVRTSKNSVKWDTKGAKINVPKSTYYKENKNIQFTNANIVGSTSYWAYEYEPINPINLTLIFNIKGELKYRGYTETMIQSKVSITDGKLIFSDGILSKEETDWEPNTFTKFNQDFKREIIFQFEDGTQKTFTIRGYYWNDALNEPLTELCYYALETKTDYKYIIAGETAGTRQLKGCSKNSCFPGNSKLILKDGTKKIFHEIEVGDEIQVCSNNMELFYSKVIFLPHLQNNESAEYIKFTTTSNQTIRATALHLLPVLDKNNTLQNVIAKKITKEDKLYVLNNGKGVPEEIKTIETIQEKGVYTCLVKEGEYIVVDNIVASPFPGDGLEESYVSKYAFSYTMLKLIANGFSMLDNIGVLKYIAPLLRFMVFLVADNCQF